jgi:poly [ADP-ribose] polymerase 6/8
VEIFNAYLVISLKMSDDSEPEEVIIEDDSTPPSPSDSPAEIITVSPVVVFNLETCATVLPRFQFELAGARQLKIRFPSSVLPRSLSIVNQFDLHPTLMEVILDLAEIPFNSPPLRVEVTNPIFNTNFPGRPLILDALNRFFQPGFQPKKTYQSWDLIREPVGTPPDALIARLASEGFELEAAAHALVLTHGNLSRAKEFLLTGTTPGLSGRPEIAYGDCPLLYMLLEAMDALLSITDHCCVCGADLGYGGVKPTVCTAPLCLFGVANIGIGGNVMGELRRDPAAADFLVCLASAAFGTALFTPPLPQDLVKDAERFFKQLPAIDRLLRYNDDLELTSGIGRPFVEILRFILSSNRTHLISLPNHLKLEDPSHPGAIGKVTEQFLCVAAAPEREAAFQVKKQASGSFYVWHGSPVTNWHSILRKGLGHNPLIEGNPQYAAYPGYASIVWHAAVSTYSMGYANKGGVNTIKYANSRFDQTMTILGVVENIKGMNVVRPNMIFTQGDLTALVARCLVVVNSAFVWDLVKSPPKHVPTLDDCLKYLATRGLH